VEVETYRLDVRITRMWLASARLRTMRSFRPVPSHSSRRRSTLARSDRRGTYIVEFALVFPVFMTFLMGLVEFGHANLVINSLHNAARIGARMGTVNDVTNAQVTTRVQQVVGSAIRTTNVTVLIKDASSFETGTLNPTSVNYSSLPDITLKTAEASQMFLVRVTVPYNQVALLPPFWAKNLTLSGQSVMRHE
jgi:Flp pilus assembly protein TadG